MERTYLIELSVKEVDEANMNDYIRKNFNAGVEKIEVIRICKNDVKRTFLYMESILTVSLYKKDLKSITEHPDVLFFHII